METIRYHEIADDSSFLLRVFFAGQTGSSWHAHDFTELTVIIEGHGIHQTPFGQYEIQTGDVFVIPEGGCHRYLECSADLELLNVVFRQDSIPLPMLDMYQVPGYNALFSLQKEYFNSKVDYPHFRCSDGEFATIHPILEAMRIESLSLKPGYRFCLLGHFMALTSNLSRFYTVEQNPRQRQSFQIAKILSFLNHYYREEIFLDELCHMINMSRSTFRRHFLLATGMTPMAYLNSIRLHHACIALRNPGVSITEIAVKCGFPDGSFFTRLFRKTLGITPCQFRAQWKSATN